MNLPLLKETCETPGAPGYESRIRAFIIEKIKNLVDSYEIDAIGNLIALKKGQTSEKSVVVAAHMDEIAFMLTHIDDNGFIRFHTLGGFDPNTLVAQRVIIHGKEDVIGVMGTKPIHIKTAEERGKPLKIKEFYIDTGLTKDELSSKIHVGATITRERELIEMGACVNGKSLDNRVSVYVLMECLKKLKDTKVPYDFYAVFSVQEEVGLRGATVAAQAINPDFGIGLDTTLANDLPGVPAQDTITKLGGGTAIKIMDSSVICDYRMVEYMKKVASEHKIKHQMEVLTVGGTDTAALQRYGSKPTITGAISIPLRYIHQVVEMGNKEDIDNSIDLLTKVVSYLDKFDWSH